MNIPGIFEKLQNKKRGRKIEPGLCMKIVVQQISAHTCIHFWEVQKLCSDGCVDGWVDCKKKDLHFSLI